MAFIKRSNRVQLSQQQCKKSYTNSIRDTMDISRNCELTCERQTVSSDGQQVVDVEQENRVAQDDRHLKKGAFDALRRQQEAEEVQYDEEAAGEQEVHHIYGGLAP